MTFFFAKLVPPRPTFIFDMNEEERVAVLAHDDYWLPHINAGLVIAMGAVHDPKGVYGMILVNAPSEQMLRDWQAKDPLILQGFGFTFENYPMPSVRVAPVEPLAPVSSVSP